MATTNTLSDPAQQETTATSPLLISLPSLDHDAFTLTVKNIAEAFPGADLIVSTPDAASAASSNGIRITGYPPAAPSSSSWTLTAADFLNSYELAQKHESKAILQLGAEAQSLEPAALRTLAQAVLDGKLDLAVPHYALPPRAGLVNSAILYPMTRALFGARPRFPLAIDLGLSSRALERLAAAAQRFTSTNQPDAFIWPVSEISVAGYSIDEVEAGPRTLPTPTGQDLNSILASVAGSLFADMESKAAYWQRARTAQPPRLNSPRPTPGTDPISPEEAQPMIESFRLAYGNLHEIWSLVLPPQSLLGLKRLSVLPPASFVMPDSLWARIVYDFLLAYRLRTINRGHLLGALTPLYLAWVASHVLQTGTGIDPERHIEAVAAAFEADKPYLVSRWRWPDRFNP
jgi:glucosylglycerate synthase